jgi:hypothetical protein
MQMSWECPQPNAVRSFDADSSSEVLAVPASESMTE